MTLYQLELTTRAPLHIGSGGAPLRRNVDFASFGRFLYVLDLDAVLDYIVPEDADVGRIDEIMRSQNLASFLKESDVRQQPGLTRYRLGGTATVGEIRPQIKDLHGRPYIPGSTIKGAIRTALGTAIAQSKQIAIAESELGQRRERAASGMEQKVFGVPPKPAQAPNYDLMRSIQVADSAPVPADTLELDNIAVWPAGQRGIPIDIEAIRPGTVFACRVKLDDYLLGRAASSLGFGAGVEHVHEWIRICQDQGIAQMRQEASFFEGRAPMIERFYGALLKDAEQQASDTFFMQLGWGAGWNTKTLSRIIQPNRTLLARIVERYRLTRGFYHPGTPFPKTRHVVADRGQPLSPLGWVHVRVRS